MGMVQVFVVVNVDLSGWKILGPLVICLRLCAQVVSLSLKYVLVAPVSAFRLINASLRDEDDVFDVGVNNKRCSVRSSRSGLIVFHFWFDPVLLSCDSKLEVLKFCCLGVNLLGLVL